MKNYAAQRCASDATDPVRVGNETLNNQGLSGKVWSSDSCLSYSSVDDKMKYKQFSSMCDLSGGNNQTRLSLNRALRCSTRFNNKCV